MSTIWELVKKANSQLLPTPHLLKQNINFNRSLMEFACALKFDKHWPVKPRDLNSIRVQSFTNDILLANCLLRCPMMHRCNRGWGKLLF